MKITYWSDYACPFCYIGEVRMKKAIAELPQLGEVEMEMKSFELDPYAANYVAGGPAEHLAKKYSTSIEAARQQIERISNLGKEDGLEMNFGKVKSCNTMDAHRLTKLAQSKNDRDLTDKLIEALFKAYFSDNELLSDHTVLCRIGVECGLDEKEITEVLESDQYRGDVDRDEMEAARYGIHAVPFFIVGKYGISGAQNVDVMKKALTTVLEETSQGMSCDISGCK